MTKRLFALLFMVIISADFSAYSADVCAEIDSCGTEKVTSHEHSESQSNKLAEEKKENNHDDCRDCESCHLGHVHTAILSSNSYPSQGGNYLSSRILPFGNRGSPLNFHQTIIRPPQA